MNDARFTELFNLTSSLSLVFQISATLLVAVLSFVVSRGVRRRQMLYWAAGWTCYAVALIAIMVLAYAGPAAPVALLSYFAFEYAAVLLIFAGCRYTADDVPFSRRLLWMLVPAALLSAALVAWPTTFFWKYAVHTAVLGLAWLVCLAALWPAVRRPHAGPGVKIVAVGLVLLALDYLQHLPTGWDLAAHHVTQSPYYFTIISLVDGMLEFVLGFGTVVVIVDKVRDELEAANVRLKAAHDRAAQALHTDPLTDVLNRYSFAATFEERADRRTHHGSVVMIDVDGLKRVNDTFGHAAGDSAIRAAADGIRSLVRQEDKVYRWGGDEFVIVMKEMPLDAARRRMLNLDTAINRQLELGHGAAGTLSVSWGAAEFGPQTPIKDAIERADAAMYDDKSNKADPIPGHRN